jgi:excisionase family DNA binding protein
VPTDSDRRVSLVSPLWTASDVAERLGLPKRTVYDFTRRGLLPKIQLGRHVRYAPADVEARLAELSSGGTPS